MLVLYSYVLICVGDGSFLFHTLGMPEIEFEFLGKKISQTVKYMCIKYIKEWTHKWSIGIYEMKSYE